MQESQEEMHGRLDGLVTSERQHANAVNQKLHVASIDVAKEKTQFVEKIALGIGAVITAIVSFMGSHCGNLRPIWIVRAALVLLVLALFLALFRNWIYSFYTLVFHLRLDYEAKQRLEDAKANFIQCFPAADRETGTKIDSKDFLEQHKSNKKERDAAIAKLLKREDRIMFAAKYSEIFALCFAATAIAGLVVIAWTSF